MTLPSWLLVGDKALARDRVALQRHKVRYIVNATPSLSGGGVANYFQSDATFDYLRVELRDVATENILPSLPAATEFLQRARVRADGRALIHCNEGKCRSVVVAAGFLISAYGMSVAEALAAVRSARPQAAPREVFCKQLGTLVPTKLPCEIDGFAEPPSRSPGALAASSVRAGPTVAGPAPRPVVGPAIGPPRAAIGPAPPPRRCEGDAADVIEPAAKRRAIGPIAEPPVGPIGLVEEEEVDARTADPRARQRDTTR